MCCNHLSDLEKKLSEAATEALKNYKELGQDPKTPAAVKERIYAKIIDLAGMKEDSFSEFLNAQDRPFSQALRKAQERQASKLFDKELERANESLENSKQLGRRFSKRGEYVNKQILVIELERLKELAIVKEYYDGALAIKRCIDTLEGD